VLAGSYAVVLALVALGSAGAAPQTHDAPGLRLDPAFRAEILTRGLTHPTAIAYGPDGRIYATEDVGKLVAVTPRGAVQAVAAELRTPLGLVWRGESLFVSEQGRMERFDFAGGRVVKRRVVISGLPYHLHQQDNVVLWHGRLYFGSGSTCDACRERSRLSAAILSMRPDGSDLRVEASGLRNPFGLALDPRTNRLYVTVNGRDHLGPAEPAELLVRFRHGANYGWPDCWGSARRHRLEGSCGGVTQPVAYLEAHSSADGIVVYRGSSFPSRYRGDIYVAEWGQYDSTRAGRRVVRISLGPDGKATVVATFADGFDHPVALTVDQRGALLVADWGRSAIYRIQTRGQP
jgi:glucose/arabinose dehydrogenase